MSFARATEAPFVALDYTNETDGHKDIDYASVTAPGPCYLEVRVFRDRKHPKVFTVADAVYVSAGGSHSWWAGAHGKLLRRGLQPGERVLVQGTAEFAF